MNKLRQKAKSIALSVLISGCTIQDRPYHFDSDKPYHAEWSVNNFGVIADDKSNDIKKRSSHPFSSFTLEYDENGKLFCNSQLENVLTYIKTSNKKKFIVAYIHGWNHNADVDDDNFESFGNFLERHANQLKRLGKNDYEVVGIYIGWGAKIVSQPFNYLRLVDVAKKANTISQGILKDDLKKIADKMLENDSDNKMQLWGLSLGGRIETKSFISANKPGEKINLQPLGENTLIISVNAAVDASDYENIFSQSQSFEKRKYPTWINFTSVDDIATRCFYPLLAPHEINASSHPSAGKTIGHYWGYQTHKLHIDYIGECDHGVLKDSPDSSKNYLCPDIEKYNLETDIPTNWYRQSPTVLFPITYKHLTNTSNGLDVRDFAYYFAELKQLSVLPANGQFWNIYTDKNTIDTDALDFAGEHTGFIQTNLVRLVDELLFIGFDEQKNASVKKEAK